MNKEYTLTTTTGTKYKVHSIEDIVNICQDIRNEVAGVWQSSKYTYYQMDDKVLAYKADIIVLKSISTGEETELCKTDFPLSQSLCLIPTAFIDSMIEFSGKDSKEK